MPEIITLGTKLKLIGYGMQFNIYGQDPIDRP